MAWEWSHSPDAYEDLRRSLAALPLETLQVIYAEWCAVDGGAQKPKRLVGSTCDMDLERYERKLGKLRAGYETQETLAERIYALAEGQALCTNGGREAWTCPYGCGPHTIAWDDWKDREGHNRYCDLACECGRSKGVDYLAGVEP